MPIYEYKCNKCKNEFECLVFRSDETVCCPKCNDDCVDRLMSACNFKSSKDYSAPAASTSSSSCAGCAGTSCATCH